MLSVLFSRFITYNIYISTSFEPIVSVYPLSATACCQWTLNGGRIHSAKPPFNRVRKFCCHFCCVGAWRRLNSVGYWKQRFRVSLLETSTSTISSLFGILDVMFQCSVFFCVRQNIENCCHNFIWDLATLRGQFCFQPSAGCLWICSVVEVVVIICLSARTVGYSIVLERSRATALLWTSADGEADVLT